MNSYIKSQCSTIIASVKVFEQACQLAAMKDDGDISREEEKKLKKISKANQQFIANIEKLMK